MKVCIDPGHAPGNTNKGPTGYYEYAGMWKLSNYLKNALIRCGINANLTRSENENPSLAERGKRAKGSDIFISEHSNAANIKARGVECYYSLQRPGDKIWAERLSAAVSALMANNDRGAKTRESTRTKGYDYYGVIRSAVAADISHVFLHESGFHDNSIDEAFLKIDTNLEKIAEAQAKVLCELIGVEYIGKGAAATPPSLDLYRVRKSWGDASSQIGAYTIFDNAKKAAYDSKAKGYKVYDAKGNIAYDPNVTVTQPETSIVGTPIIGPATGTAAQGRAWATSKGASATFVGLAEAFWKVATAVGVNPVVVYCQSAKETGFGMFGGVLDASFMNPCGMKTSGGGDNYDPNAHQRFESWAQGIAAQIDHLALYAGALGYPKAGTPDPRHFPFIRGRAETVEELGGNWAPSATYGNDIVKMMAQLEGTLADTAPVSSSDVIYCVQTGAFSVKKNADALAARLKAAGFDAYVTKKEKTP